MIIRNLIRMLGIDVVRYPYKPIVRVKRASNEWYENRFKLIDQSNIDLVLDVGANVGKYGIQLRRKGYKGQIVSFEPLEKEFSSLKEASAHDPLWRVHNFALGELTTTSTINVAGNSESSSILDMEQTHEESAPDSVYIGKQLIEIKALDDIFDEFSSFKRIYLKLDVQGYEERVFKGLTKNLSKICAIQIEMSLVELYKGEKTFFEQSQFLLSNGFRLMSLEPGFFDPKSGQLLQTDGIWFR